MTREIFVPSRELLVVTELDDTCRDAAQALPESNQFPVGSKPEIADKIARLGTRTIQAGFPMTPGDAEQVREVAESVGNGVYAIVPKRIVGDKLVSDPEYSFTPIITALSPAKREAVEVTFDAVKSAKYPGMHIFMPTEERNIRARFPNMTKEEVLQMGVDAARYARQIGGPDIILEFTLEVGADTFRRDPKWLEHCARSILLDEEANIDVLNVPDSTGGADGDDIYDMFARITKWVIEEGRAGDVTISTHNHADGGAASSNSVMAARAVADTAVAMSSVIPRFQVEVANGAGLGERVENTNHALFVLNMLQAVDKGRFPVAVEYQVDTLPTKSTAEFVMDKAGLEVSLFAPVIGEGINWVSSGIHAAVINRFGASAYNPFDPRWFGHKHATVIKPGVYQGSRGRKALGPVESYESETYNAGARSG
jgi:isopropylmalate/homocitrate/citramalate synthase